MSVDVTDARDGGVGSGDGGPVPVRVPWWASPWAAETAVAAVCTALLVTISAHLPAKPGDHPVDAVGYVLLVVAGVATGVCRRLPRVVVAVVSVVLAVAVLRHYPDGPLWACGWIALGALSRQTDRRTAVTATAGMLVVLSAAALVAGHAGLLLPLIFVGWAAAAVLCGDVLRDRRGYLAGLQERTRYLERTREEEARRRVAEERLKIARDLHDSVAHAMATINVQAGAAAYVLQRRPEAAGDALAVIQRASGEVIEELTAMVAVLREGGQRAELAPAPSITQIARLVDDNAASGLAVALSLEGPTSAVQAVVGTAAYRVVQESLTNVRRHSKAGAARVSLVVSDDGGLVVEVADDGPPGGACVIGTGVGLRGMRERVTLTGGGFEAGPTAHGGFLVRAEWEGQR